MPLSLKALTSKTAAKVIDFGDGDVLNVTYYPARISGKMVAYYGSVNSPADLIAMPTDQAISYLTSPAETLMTLLASWDLEDEDANGVALPVPLDLAHLEDLGIEIQWGILNNLLGSDAGAADAKSGAPTPTVVASGSASATPSADTSSPTAA